MRFFRSALFRSALILVAALPLLGACVTPAPDRLLEIVTAEAVPFDPETVPVELVETLSTRRVILLGETHYVQEHQEFIVRLIRELHPEGLRYFVQELSHASGWAVDDYVTGRRDDYPDSVRTFDEYWIEALRRFNQDLPVDQRIRFRYNDMNHNPAAFHFSLQMMARESPVTATLVCSLLVTRPDTEEYEAALHELHRLLRENQALLAREIGSPWFERLLETIEIEVRSLPLRRRWDVAEREKIMIELSTGIIGEAQDDQTMVAINTGMFHAQKERFMGTRQQWLGEYLVENPQLYGGPPGLYSMAFFGLRGTTIRTFMEPEPQPFTPATERNPRNLVRAIAEVAQRQPTERHTAERQPSAVYLDLSHPVFQRRMPMAFTRSVFRTVPGRQFDGYIAYPKISVLRSITGTPAISGASSATD